MAIEDNKDYTLKGSQVKDLAGRVKENASDIAGLETTVAGKQDALSVTQLAAVNSGIDATKVAQISTNATDIDGIEAKIPAQATSSNQLADKAFVNSSVATNTANFVGTFNTIEELEAVQNPTNNDYGFVIGTDSSGNTVYNRYKFNGTAWVFEYALNNSSFTAEQWAAIQSGITAGLVTKLNGIEAGAEVNTIDSISVNGTAVMPDANKNVDILIPDGVLLLDVDNHTLTADELQAFKDAWDSREPIFVHYGAVGGQIVHSQTGNTLDWTQPQTFSAIMMMRSTVVDNPKLQGATVTFTPSTMNLNLLWNAGSNLPTEGESSLSTTSNGNAWVKKSAIRTALAGKADNTAFTGTDGTTAGTQGLVPAPATTDAGKFLKADGTWGEAGGGIRTLTTADYNYPTSNPDGISIRPLDDGYYIVGESMKIYKHSQSFESETFAQGSVLIKVGGHAIWKNANSWQSQFTITNDTSNSVPNVEFGNIVNALDSSSSVRPLSAAQGKVLNEKIEGRVIQNAGAPTTSTVGTVGMLLEDTTNGKLYQCTAVDTSSSPAVYTWTEVGGGGGETLETIVLSPGTSSLTNYALPLDEAGKFIDALREKPILLTVEAGSGMNYIAYISSLLYSQTIPTNVFTFSTDYIRVCDSQWGSASPTNEPMTGVFRFSVDPTNRTVSIVSADGLAFIGAPVNNLTTNTSNRALSAAQGKALKDLIDALDAEVANKLDDVTTFWGQTANNGAVSGTIDLGDGAAIETYAAGGTDIDLLLSRTDGTYTSAIDIGSRGIHIGTSDTTVITFDTASGGVVSAGGAKIIGVGNPTSGSDAANKNYVDSVTPVVTMSSTDPGEGATLAANHFIAYYE